MPCAVHLNGDAVKSCAILAAQANGAEITTIEGIANGDELHPMQQAFMKIMVYNVDIVLLA